MNNNCIYLDYDLGDAIDPIFTNVRTARKLWKCCECGDEIKVGDRYEDVSGVYDGQWDNYRTCTRCALVAADFFRGRTFGAMIEYFEEAHGFDYRDGIPADFTPCGSDLEVAGGTT